MPKSSRLASTSCMTPLSSAGIHKTAAPRSSIASVGYRVPGDHGELLAQRPGRVGPAGIQDQQGRPRLETRALNRLQNTQVIDAGRQEVARHQPELLFQRRLEPADITDGTLQRGVASAEVHDGVLRVLDKELEELPQEPRRVGAVIALG